MQIPVSSVLCAANLEQLLNLGSEESDDTVVLTRHLLELFGRDLPSTQVLRALEFGHHPLCWGAERLQELQHDELAAAIAHTQAELRASYQAHIMGASSASWEAYRHSHLCVLTRSMQCNMHQAEGEARSHTCLMIGCLDLCNHRTGEGFHIQWPPYATGNRSIVVRAARSYSAGEQLYLDYGVKTDADMLITHGFVDGGAGDQASSAVIALEGVGKVELTYGLAPAEAASALMAQAGSKAGAFQRMNDALLSWLSAQPTSIEDDQQLLQSQTASIIPPATAAVTVVYRLRRKRLVRWAAACADVLSRFLQREEACSAAGGSTARHVGNDTELTLLRLQSFLFAERVADPTVSNAVVGYIKRGS